MGGWKAEEAVAEGTRELFEGILDREDGEEVGEGVHRRGTEASRDAPEGVILGDSGQLDEVFRGLEAPERGAVREDGEDDGMVDSPPIGKVQSTDRVAQDVERTNRGTRPIGHDFDVMRPIEGLVEVNAEVADKGGAADSDDAMSGIAKADVGGEISF